jgi:preprotein translocase subunit SecE
MSEERLEPIGESEVKSDKKSKKAKKKRKNPIVKYFREMKSELKKVVWPTSKQIVNNTTLVLVIMVISGIVIWGVDKAGEYIVNSLILLGGK